MRCPCLVALLVAACSDSPSSPPVDAGTLDVSGPGPGTCLVPSTFADLGALAGMAMQGIPTSLSVTIDPGPPRDTFFIRLDDGDGVFANGVVNGTYPLTGTELDYESCGLCVSIIADIVAGQGPSKFYFATGGSVTLTGTSPPAGTLTDVTLEEVTSGGVATGSGCTTSITSLSFGP